MPWANRNKAKSYKARENDPVLFVEQIALAEWKRQGEPISEMAYRLQRSIPQVRKMVFG